jgi:amino acid permease
MKGSENMSDTQKLFCMIYTGYTFIVLNLVWMGIEKLLYGAIQHRVVDDIISVPLILIIYLMWKFKTERDNLHKGLKY